jgi:hypothetical protein
MTVGTPFWQQILAGGINHAATQGIAKAIDWLRDLPDEEVRQISMGLNPEYAARFLGMVREARRVL